jgi:hypothetical protein
LPGLDRILFFVHAEGFSPGLAGRDVVSDSMVGIAEVGADICLGRAVTELTDDDKCLPVAIQGLSVLTKLVVSPAYAAEGDGFPALVGELAERSDGLLAVGQGARLIAEFGVEKADVVESAGYPGVVTDSAVELQGLPGVAEGIAVPLILSEREAHALMGHTTAEIVSEILEQLQSP